MAYGFSQKTEIEDSLSVFNAYSISHGCAAPGLDDVKPATQSILFPNGADNVSKRTDNGEFASLAEYVNGNTIMLPKPVKDHSVNRYLPITDFWPSSTGTNQ